MNLEDCDKYNCEPPSVNTKCIVFTLFVVTIYWFVPKNKWILLFLIFVCYIILAWYDYIYNCERNMGPTYLSLFYKHFKPQSSEQIKEYENWHPTLKKKVMYVDLFILLVLVMLFPIYYDWEPKY